MMEWGWTCREPGWEMLGPSSRAWGEGEGHEQDKVAMGVSRVGLGRADASSPTDFAAALGFPLVLGRKLGVTWRDGRVARKRQSHLPGGELTSPWQGRVGGRRSSSPLCSEKSRNTGRARLHLPIDLRGTSMRASPKSAPKSSLPFQQ